MSTNASHSGGIGGAKILDDRPTHSCKAYPCVGSLLVMPSGSRPGPGDVAADLGALVPLVAVVLTGLCTCLLVAMARRLAPSAEQCWRIGRRASVERMPPARPVARRQV